MEVRAEKEENMADKQDSGDEMQTISHKFRSVTTIEPVFNVPEQTNNGSPSSSQVDDKVSSTVKKKRLVRKLPELNLPEKILLVVDTVRERNFTPYKLGSGAKYWPLFMIKRAIENFVYAKSTIQRSHEFALMTLDSQSTQWICDFTNNTKSFVNHLETVVEDVLEEEPKTYDLGQIFEKIQARLPFLSKNRDTQIPTFVTRVILVYARSNCIPKFHTGQKCFESLMENPYFFVDALYVHEPPSDESMCDDIYAEITALDTTNLSYILEVGRNAAKLHDSMAKLVAHPLQRPLQKNACYTIDLHPSLQEVHTNV